MRRGWTDLPGLQGTMATRVRIACSWLTHKWNRLLRGPSTTVALGSTVASAAGIPSAPLNVAPPPVPSDVTEQIAWLVDQVQELQRQVDRRTSDNADLVRARDSDHKRFTEEIARLESESRARVADLAGGGLRLQAWGVFFLLAGTACVMLGSAWS